MKKKQYKPGDLQVWWVPQVPGKAFNVDVSSVEEAAKLMTVLADYDLFQFKNKIKPDYCNAGGLNIYEADSDGEGTPEFVSWIDEETGEGDPVAWLAAKEQA